MATKKEKKKTNIFVRVLQGRVLSYKFFVRYSAIFLGVLVVILVAIAGKFHNQSQKDEIIKLKSRLNYVSTEYVKACGEYNSQIRESEMKARIDSMRINLSVAEQPPFQLK